MKRKSKWSWINRSRWIAGTVPVQESSASSVDDKLDDGQVPLKENTLSVYGIPLYLEKGESWTKINYIYRY